MFGVGIRSEFSSCRTLYMGRALTPPANHVFVGSRFFVFLAACNQRLAPPGESRFVGIRIRVSQNSYLNEATFNRILAADRHSVDTPYCHCRD
jgi:hypothetical protein